jgi:hypothetical protein
MMMIPCLLIVLGRAFRALPQIAIQNATHFFTQRRKKQDKGFLAELRKFFPGYFIFTVQKRFSCRVTFLSILSDVLFCSFRWVDQQTMAEEPSVPHTMMKRLVVQSPGPSVRECRIEVQNDVAVPVPGLGQVLIRVVAAAINPSDYEAWIHCRPEQCPHAMGKEGVVLSSK